MTINAFEKFDTWRKDFFQNGLSKKKLRGSILLIVGFILSPLSWWNDVFVNIPLSWVTANICSYLYPATFKWAFLVAYWVSNIAGLILIHIGKNDFFDQKLEKRSLLKSLLTMLIYSLGILLLIQTKIFVPISIQLLK